MTASTFIAIDPGVTGAMVLSRTGLNARRIHPSNAGMVTASVILANVVLNRLANPDEEIHAVIEEVHSSPVQGHSSAFKFGQNYGEWIGMLRACNISTWAVRPQVWQYDLKIASRGAERKRDLRKVCQDRWPGLRITSDNCDAILLSDWVGANDYAKQKRIL